MADAPSFDIEELTGQRRSIRLRGRSLPYQNVAWTQSTRTKLTWYPGNPVATLQVLGPEYGSTKINGMWKDRFIIGQAEVRGFDKPGTAENMVQIFKDLQRSGNDLRVQWGIETRFGVISQFEANWVRPQDVSWNCEFVWTGEQQTAPRAGEAPQTNEVLRRAITATDDDFILDPKDVLPEYRDPILEQIDAMRGQVGTVFDAVRQIQEAVDVPLTAVQGALTAVEAIRATAEETIGNLVDAPYTYAQTFDFVAEVLGVEVWRRTVSGRVRSQRAAAQKQGRSLAKAAVPTALAVIVVPGETTLRQLAVTYYGSADDWQIIADVNGINTSTVPAGTLLVITPKPSANGIPST